jgi:hypothetical protein
MKLDNSVYCERVAPVAALAATGAAQPQEASLFETLLIDSDGASAPTASRSLAAKIGEYANPQTSKNLQAVI